MTEEFQMFTDRARKVLTYAQEEAQRFNHSYIGTEHLLLGLVREGGGVAARVLSNMGVEQEKVRAAVEFIVGRGDSWTIVHEMGLTPRAKRVIELAVDEAQRLNHRYIGTEHLLLGLLVEGEGIAAGVLESLGVRLPEARQQIMQVIGQGGTFVGTGEMVRGPVAAAVPAPLGDLLRVIPIARTQAVGDGTVTLLSLELYAHGFIIHYRIISNDHLIIHQSRIPHLGPLDFNVIDDRGGRFDGNQLFGGFDPHAWYYGYVYRPAVDPEARELRVLVQVMGGPAASPESSPESETASPLSFTFSILLHPEGR